MNRIHTILALVALLFITPTWAKSNVELVVEEPFIELRTGPGRGYPVFYVVEQGAAITVTRRRTEWFEVISPRGQEGWVHRDALELTLDPEGMAIRVEDSSFGSYYPKFFCLVTCNYCYRGLYKYPYKNRELFLIWDILSMG